MGCQTGLMYSSCEQGNGGTVLISTTLKNDHMFIRNVHHSVSHNNVWTILNSSDQYAILLQNTCISFDLNQNDYYNKDWFIHYLNHKTITVCLKETTEASSE